MFDTVHLWLGSERVGHLDPARASLNLSNVTEHITHDSMYYTGSLGGNCRVSISMRGISIKGSLSAFYLGSNCKDLTIETTREAIEKMSSLLGVELDDAKVTRLDIAKNFFTPHKPKAYFPYLGDCKYFQRIEQPDSLYYQNGQRVKLFYDKAKECKKKRITVPKSWEGKNVLRYEVRYLKRLVARFNVNEAKASMLYDEGLYRELGRLYKQEYKDINRLSPPFEIDYSLVKTPKDFLDQITSQAIQEKGLCRVLKMVDEMKELQRFSSKEAYSRLKFRIKKSTINPNPKYSILDEVSLQIQNLKLL